MLMGSAIKQAEFQTQFPCLTAVCLWENLYFQEHQFPVYPTGIGKVQR